MAQRRIFTAKSEILAQQFTNMRNDYEKLLFENFVKNAVPRMPSFVGGGFKPSLSGNQVTIAPGIGFQEVAQTDGSSPVRLMLLTTEQTMSFVLPAAGQTKKALVQARSQIVNDPQQSRNLKVGASVVSRDILVSNRWSAQVQVKDNVTADANGNYVADIGWVPVAIVSLNSSGITALEDARDFYNLFDPDFFSVYGRKNVSFQRPYDGVNLVEVPFEFSDLVSKIDQVSVRRVTKEKFGASIVSAGFTSPQFALPRPVSTVTSINKRNFISASPREVTLSPQNVNRGNFRLNGGNLVWTNYSSSPSRSGWDDGFFFDFKNGNLDLAYIDDIDNLNSVIPNRTIYLLFWNSRQGQPSATNAVVYAITYPSRVIEDYSPSSDIAPLFKSGNISTSFNRVIVSTVNPVVQASGQSNYVLGNPVNIPNFYQLKEFIYNPTLKRLQFALKDTTAGTTAFPSAGAVFNALKIKKGSETRLSLAYRDFSVSLPTVTTGGGGTGALARQATKDINLGTGVWRGEASDGTTLWFVDRTSNYARAYVASTRARDATKDINLGAGDLRGAASDGTTLWFVDNISGYARAYVASTRARDATKDINLGTGVWRGAASDGTTLWFVDRTSNYARAYVASTHARDATKDINLGAGDWIGGVSDGTTLWFLNSNVVTVRAYVASTRARDPSKDINLGAGVWRGGVSDGTTLWFVDNISGYARAYSIASTSGVPVVTTGDTAEYTYNLTSQDTLIKSGDSAFRDFSMEFDRRVFQGEDIWRANKMRGGSVLSSTVDFKLEEEGLRTYVRLNDQYPFKADDQLIFSHIIPQELIDAGSGGTPEDQDVATQVAALQASLAALQRDVTANKGDIDTLENQTAASRVTFYYGILSVGIRNATSRANAKSVSHLTPLVGADFSTPANRTSKEISSLLLSGGLVLYNAGATAGYYSPWVAVETNDLSAGGLGVVGPGGDESSLWRPAGTATLSGKNYSFFVRVSPLLNGKSLRVIFRTFE